MKALTENMRLALVAMLELERVPMSKPWHGAPVADIAAQAGFTSGMDGGRRSHDARVMSPAQRLITPLTQLYARGLVAWGERPDGRSGTAYLLTEEGRTVAIGLQREYIGARARAAREARNLPSGHMPYGGKPHDVESEL